MATELGIKKIHEMLLNTSITPEELIEESIKKSHDINTKCNAFVTIMDDAKKSNNNVNILNNIPYGIKDNYSTKGILSTGSSNTLKDYVPVFDATVIKKLKACGAVAINKTAMDEFGMGGSGTTAHTGIIKNPWDLERMCAGSSAGSACAVAAGVYPFALGTDTGDSIRKPAAYCGIVGFKPTYGMISRYGVFPFASSLDHCGCFARSVHDAAIVVDNIKGLDELDMTTWDSSKINLVNSLSKEVKGKKLFYIDEIVNKNNYKNPSKELLLHLDNFQNTIEKIEKLGIEVTKVNIDKLLLNAISSVYTCISCAEATSNMSNLTGIIFGPRGNGDSISEIMKDHRTKGFSPLIKRRFIIGAYVLQKENQEKYYLNACRVRRLIVNKMKELFEDYDGLILPVSTGVAPLLEQNDDILVEKDTTILEEHLQIGNFGGFPSITIPSGFINELPLGINITSNCFEDENLLNIAYNIESILGYKDQFVSEVK